MFGNTHKANEVDFKTTWNEEKGYEKIYDPFLAPVACRFREYGLVVLNQLIREWGDWNSLHRDGTPAYRIIHFTWYRWNQKWGESVKLSLNDIPQYKNYLLNEGDIQTEIARTQFTSLDVPSSNMYVMLKYGCGAKDCSTILVQTDGNKSEGLTMPVGIFQDYKVSSDHKKVLIRYAYDEGSLVKRQILVAVDLEKLKIVPYTSAALEEPFMLKPTWPIISYDWINNNQFNIETAALETSEYSALKNWFSSENRKTRKVTIGLDVNKRLNEYPKAM